MSRLAELSPYAPPVDGAEVSSPELPLLERRLSWRVGMWLALGELGILLCVIAIQILDGTLVANAFADFEVPVNLAERGLDWILRCRDIWFPVLAITSFVLLAKLQFDLSRRRPRGRSALLFATIGIALLTACLYPLTLLLSYWLSTLASSAAVEGAQAFDTSIVTDLLSEAGWNTVAFFFPLAAGGSLRLLEIVLGRED